jgi:hypothetical protein
MPMSKRSQQADEILKVERHARMRELANKIINDLRKKYPGYDAIGPKEIAEEINRRTTARQTSSKSIANALRDGRIHNGGHWPIDHPPKTIWSVSIEAAGINIAEIVSGETLPDFGLSDLRKWVVVSVSLAPFEIHGVATDIVVLDYQVDRSVAHEQANEPRIQNFLEAIAAALDLIKAEEKAAADLSILRKVSGLSADNETEDN